MAIEPDDIDVSDSAVFVWEIRCAPQRLTIKITDAGATGVETHNSGGNL